MHTKTAYKIAIECIEKERRYFASGHVLYNAGQRAIFCKNHHKKYERFNEAIAILDDKMNLDNRSKRDKIKVDAHKEEEDE